MQPSISEPYRPSSIIVHNLINKLSVIIGRCDLMMDMAEDETEWANRLLEIRELAKSMAHEIVQDRSDCRCPAELPRKDECRPLKPELEHGAKPELVLANAG